MWKRLINHPWVVAVVGGAAATGIAAQFLTPADNSRTMSYQPIQSDPVVSQQECKPRVQHVNEVVMLVQGYPSRPMFKGELRIFVKANDVRREDREVHLTFAREEYSVGGLFEIIPLGRRREVKIDGHNYVVLAEETGKLDVEGVQITKDYVNLRVEAEAIVDDCK